MVFGQWIFQWAGGAFLAMVTFVPAFAFGIYKLFQSSPKSVPPPLRHPLPGQGVGDRCEQKVEPDSPRPSHSSSYVQIATELSVFVKTLTGKIVSIQIRSDETIAALKQKIQDKEGVPPDQQRLIFQGKQLYDSWTLADHGVKDNDVTFHLNLRLN